MNNTNNQMIVISVTDLKAIIAAELRSVISELNSEYADITVPDWMTRKQSADYLSVSTRTFDKMRKEEIVTDYNTEVGLRFYRKELEKILKAKGGRV